MPAQTRLTISQSIFFLLSCLVTWTASAQTIDYQVLLDTDNNTSTGCELNLPQSNTLLEGFEAQVIAQVSQTDLSVITTQMLSCTAGVFANPVPQDAPFPYPIGLNNGLNGGDVVEFRSNWQQLVGAGGLTARAVFVAQTPSSEDHLAVATNGGPILIHLQTLGIPTLGSWSLLAVGLLLVGLALTRLRHGRFTALAALLLSGLSLAAGFVLDGQIGDWDGEPLLGGDPAGDALGNPAPLNSTDLLAAFSAQEGDWQYFRVDVVDLENQPPVALDDNYSTDEDTPLTVDAANGVLSNDSDPESSPLSLELLSDVSNATLVLNPDGSFDYTPDADFNGEDSFSYRVSDGQLYSQTATVSLTVNAVNDPPTITIPADQSTDEDTLLVLSTGNGNVLLFADVDAGDANLSLSLAVNDGILTLTNTTDISITAGADASASLTLEGTLAALNAALDGLSYTPDENFNGSDTLSLSLDDLGNTGNGGAQSVSDTLNIDVTAINDPPVLNLPGPQNTLEDSPLDLASGISLADPDADPDELALSLDVTLGTLTLGSTAGITITSGADSSPSVSFSGTLADLNSAVTGLIFTPTPNANGTAVLSVTVDDQGNNGTGGALTDSGSLDISIIPVNDAPVFTAGPDQTVPEDAVPQTLVNWATGISDGDDGSQTLSFSITGNTNPGLFSAGPTVAADGTLSYTPAANANGSATITLVLMDNGGTANSGFATSAAQSFSITMTPVNDPPVANADDYDTSEDTPLTIPPPGVLNNDVDVDSSPLNVSAADTTTAQGGSVTVNSDGSFSYTPPLNFSGSDNFSYTVNDGTVDGNSATVSITVTPVNDPPAVTLPSPGAAFDGVNPTPLDPTATVSDVDSSDFNGGFLSADISTACDNNDQLLIANQGTGAGQIGISGSDVSFEGTLIGTFIQNSDCADAIASLVVTLNANATPVATEALARAILFDTTAASAAQRTITVTVDDGDGGTSSASATQIVTLDPAPTLDSTSPVDMATGVAVDSNIVLTFSEAVSFSGSASTLVCGSTVAYTVLGSPGTSITLDPNTPLPLGTNCTLTVVATDVSDSDVLDPPDNLASDQSFSFTIVDLPPVVNTVNPVNNANPVAADTSISLSFSEPVSTTGNWASLLCGSSGTLDINNGTLMVGGSGSTRSLSPTTPLSSGETCTLTLTSTLITDQDGIAPAELDGDASGDTTDGDVDNFSSSFTVDSGPSFSSLTAEVNNIATVVGAGTLANVDADTTLVIAFSEPVNFTGSIGAATTLDCGAGALPYIVNGSGTTTITLTPAAALPAGQVCTLTLAANEVSDVDAVDPPDNLPADVIRSFEISPQASDDTDTATTHLEISVTAPGVLGNDSPGSISGFGNNLANAAANAPGTANVATANNGQVQLNADGSFVYNPPAAFTGVDSFFYTLNSPNGGTDTAQVSITVSGPRIWFVDSTASGPIYNGTARFPFDDLDGGGNDFDGNASDIAGDAIFIDTGGSSYNCGTTLLANQILIGDGDTQALPTTLGFTPDVATTAALLPTPSGTDPLLDTTTGSCITLATGNTLRGLTLSNAPVFALDGSVVGNLTVVDTSINNTTGGGMRISTSGALSAGFNSLSSSAGNNGITLNGVSGSFNAIAGALSGASGTTFNINGGSASIVYGGTISQTTAVSAVVVNGMTGGGVDFNGAIIANTSTATGVNLTTNSGALISFDGGLDIDTTTGLGFNATGGGTVTVSGAATNTVNSTTASAVNIANTTIGAGGMTFRQLSSSGGSNPGIVLDNTGSGSFTVTGDGTTAASGGTIANKSGADNTSTGIGVLLNQTQNVSLSYMQLNDFSNFAIRGTTVNNFSLLNSAISGTNGTSTAADEGSVSFADLLGSANFTNNTISGGLEDNIVVVNTSGTLDRMTVSNGTIGLNDNASGNDGITVESQNAATLNLTVSGVNFLGARGDMVQCNALDTSTMDCVLQDNTFNNGHTNIVSGGGGNTVSGGSANANITLSYESSGSTGVQAYSGADGSALTANVVNGQGSIDGVIRNNQIGISGTAGSGGASGIALGATTTDTPATGARTNMTHNVVVDANIIQGIDSQAGLDMLANNSADINLTATFNTIREIGGFALGAVYAMVGGTNSLEEDARICADIRGSLASPQILDGNPGATFAVVALDQISATARYNLPGYTGGANGASADILSYLQNRDNTITGPGGISLVDASQTQGVTGSGVTCP